MHRAFGIAVTLVAGFVPNLPAQIRAKYDSIRSVASYETDTSRVGQHIVVFGIGYVDYTLTVGDSVGTATVPDTLLDFQKEDSTDRRGMNLKLDSVVYRSHPLTTVYLEFFSTAPQTQDGLSEVGDVAILCADGTRLRMAPADDTPDGTILLEIDFDDLRHLASGPAVGELGELPFKISAQYARILAALLSKLEHPPNRG